MDNTSKLLLSKLRAMELPADERLRLDEWLEGTLIIELLFLPQTPSFPSVIEELASGQAALCFDFDLPDDEAFEEIDVSHDPTLSKYPDLKDMEKIVELYFNTDPKKKKNFDQVQHLFRRLHSPNEIHRYEHAPLECAEF
jgi:hypothetical protein